MHRFSTKRGQRIRAYLLERDGDRCWICRCPFDRTLDGSGKGGAISIDHVVALVDGGTHDRENLRLAHRSCNTRRDVRERRTEPTTARGVGLYTQGGPARC